MSVFECVTGSERLGCIATQLHTEGDFRMDNQALVNFDPKKFIELLLKLDARAKGHEVEVEVRERKDKEF